MANHTITIINKGSRGSQSEDDSLRIGTSEKKTSASEKKKNKPSGIKPGSKKGPKVMSAASKVLLAASIAGAGINVYSSVMSAATGEEMRYSNLKALTNSIINPVGFIARAVSAAIVGDLQVERKNQELEYQRQLTGNLIYSRKFINGTF